MSEQIELISDEVTMVALKLGISKNVAADLSSAVIERLKQVINGDNIYFPKPDKVQRNKAIKMMFNGVNQVEVCAVFGISKSTLYRICK